jgi:hypothetical protein
MLEVTKIVKTNVHYEGKNTIIDITFSAPVTEDTYHALEALLDFLDTNYKKPSKKDLQAALSVIPDKVIDDEYSIVLFTLIKKQLEEFTSKVK